MHLPDKSWLSIILPTRGNRAQLTRFLDSLKACTYSPDGLEIILVVDQDDEDTCGYEYTGLQIKKVISEPGNNMGQLNQAGYEASQAPYIMLLNDDVEVQTKNWDVTVRNWLDKLHDDIVLIHVNDLIFGEKLCTFPLVGRTYCQLAGGICPTEYQRYRIDDHIYNVFNMLSMLGHRRTIYLPDIIFKHHHFKRDLKLRRVYHFVEEIMAKDAACFDALMPQRRDLCMQLASVISAKSIRERRLLDEAKLNLASDYEAIRVPKYQRQAATDLKQSFAVTQISVGCHLSDLTSPALTRLQELEREAPVIQTMTRTGGKDKGDQLSSWNCFLETAQGDYLLLLHESNPLHSSELFSIWQQLTPQIGLALNLPPAGTPQNDFAIALLVDLQQTGHLRFNPFYGPCLGTLDFALQAWEQGSVFCADLPALTDYFVGFTEDSFQSSADISLHDATSHFFHKWHGSGRLQELSNNRRNSPDWGRWAALFEAVFAKLLHCQTQTTQGNREAAKSNLLRRIKKSLAEIQF